MKQVESKQRDVEFIYCPSPITIDKRASWGDKDINIQNFPNGAFLKLNNLDVVTHGVQPNKEMNAPEGWVSDSTPGKFKKLPIWVRLDKPIPANTEYTIQTADGPITYEYDEESYVCYNGLTEPNYKDSWLQKKSDLEKNYVI